MAGILQGRGLLPVLGNHCCRLGLRCFQHRTTPLSRIRLQHRRRWQSISTAQSAAVETHPPSSSAAAADDLLPSAMSWKGRDRGCGSLTEADIGSSFTLCGWVHRQRNLGGEQDPSPAASYLSMLILMQNIIAFHAGLCFVDLRDSTGIVQARQSSTPLIAVTGLRD